jgi:pyruvate/2-oxoacid:ferredoxin oxidoreductase beta subunit
MTRVSVHLNLLPIGCSQLFVESLRKQTQNFDLVCGVTENMPSDGTAAGGESSIDRSISSAQKDLSKCMLANAWTCTVVGVAGSVPASIYLKSYSPLVIASAFGSGADYFLGFRKCRDLRQKVLDLEEMKAKSKVDDLVGRGEPLP